MAQTKHFTTRWCRIYFHFRYSPEFASFSPNFVDFKQKHPEHVLFPATIRTPHPSKHSGHMSKSQNR